jgi:hypothetical protein
MQGLALGGVLPAGSSPTDEENTMRRWMLSGLVVFSGAMGMASRAQAADPPAKPTPPVASPTPTIPVAHFTGADIDRAIQARVDYLWSQQQADGGWPPYGRRADVDDDDDEDAKLGHYFVCGPSVLAVYALLEAGVPAQNERMKKALQWLVDNREKDLKNYTVGIRCNVWLHADRQTNDYYLPYLKADVWRLIWTGAAQGGGSGYHTITEDEYEEQLKKTKEARKKKEREARKEARKEGKPVPSATDPDDVSGLSRGDNSNSQYNLLGIWAGYRNNLEIPPKTWRLAMDFWMERQLSDGGWAYQDIEKTAKKGKKKGATKAGSYGNMSAAGLASLYVCFDAYFAKQFIKCQAPRGKEWDAIQRGLAWFDKHFVDFYTSGPYFWYGVERVGLASGYKYFGKIDWFKTITARILSRAGTGGGKYGDIPPAAWEILFLVRGRQPILFNKLEFDGDWSNRPRDVANLARWMSYTFETEINWQIVTPESEVREWHDAPILYISGAQKPNFSPADLEKIKTYVLQGGTIFSVTECNGPGFRKGIREIYRELFPKYELTPIGKDHPLYDKKLLHFDLKGQPRLHQISNGIRPLVVHCDSDLALPWQINARATQKYNFEIAANLYMYVAGKGALKRRIGYDTATDEEVRYRGTYEWPAPLATPPSGRTVKVVRLRYTQEDRGHYDPEPLALQRLSRLMGVGCDVEVVVPEASVSPEDLPASGAQVAMLTGRGALPLTAAGKKALRAFTDAGGMLVIDAAGGEEKFYDKALEAVEEIWGADALKTLPEDHPLYTLKGCRIEGVKYRRLGVPFRPDKAPALKGVTQGGRVVVILSRDDLTAGLVGYTAFGCRGYMPDSAYQLVRNIVLSACGGAVAAPAGSDKPAPSNGPDQPSTPKPSRGRRLPTPRASSAGPEITQTPQDWCAVTMPRTVSAGKEFEIKVVYTGLTETTKLSCNIHGNLTGGGEGFLVQATPTGVEVKGDGAQTFMATISETEGVESIFATVFLSKDGSWPTKTKDARTDANPTALAK